MDREEVDGDVIAGVGGLGHFYKGPFLFSFLLEDEP